MYKIVKKEVLNSVVVMMEIEAPYVAARCEAGQFVIVRVDEDGERIPLCRHCGADSVVYCAV